MMVRREEFLALGGFYEPLFMYGEEADYCLRVPGRVVLAPGRGDPPRDGPRGRAGALAAPALPPRAQPPRQRGAAPPAAGDGARGGDLRRVRPAHAGAGPADGRRASRGARLERGLAGDPAASAAPAVRTSAGERRDGSSACARRWRSSAASDAYERRVDVPGLRSAAARRARDPGPRPLARDRRASSTCTCARRAAADARCRWCRPSGSASSIRRRTTRTRFPRLRLCGPPPPRSSGGDTGAACAARRWASSRGARRGGCSTWAAAEATSASCWRRAAGTSPAWSRHRRPARNPARAVCARSRGRSRRRWRSVGDGGFDAVVFQHSLEHVAEPLDDLRAAAGVLRPDGLALISLPNFGCWQARRFGADWFHLDLPRHRSHFTRRGLEALVRRAGLSPAGTSTSTSADGLPMSLQYRRYGRASFRRRRGAVPHHGREPGSGAAHGARRPRGRRRRPAARRRAARIVGVNERDATCGR